MKLKRIARMHPAWLLDGRYEIDLDYNHGHYLIITDLQTLVEQIEVYYEKKERKERTILVPQKHIYFTGGGFASKEFGLHDFPI